MTEEVKPRVLCAEDESDIRENIAEILRDEGFEVFEAENGKAGYEMFLQCKPDVIVSDIMMPEVDGYGLLKLVRQSKNSRHHMVPFIFLTALGQKDDVIKGADLTANDYLVKPVEFDLMIAKIREKVISSRRIQQIHNRDITNIKDQVSVILSAEVTNYLNVITQVSLVLKDQPYGPLPHRKYLEDIEKIYINATKLRAVISNSLDQSVIDSKIKANEEIIAVSNFVSEFIAGLSKNLRDCIEFELPFDTDSMPRLKIDRAILNDAFRKIFVGIFKFDHNAKVKITVMLDHHNNMVLVFYFTSQIAGINKALIKEEAEISKVLDQQNCRFNVSDVKENTALLTIPSYRLFSK
jgi:CheY-like chemotaxis protein